MRDLRIVKLRAQAESIWSDILSKSKLVKAIQEGATDRRLYALYLLETYHYTAHNAKNQALVFQNPAPKDIQYLRFCLRHASEEIGHEFMALHDLKALGAQLPAINELPAATSATESFVAYIYWISLNGNPLRRLGYSFWAEDAYEFIMPILNLAAKNMGLKAAQMTFFIDHARIDENHCADVHDQLIKNCKLESDWEDVREVMRTSLEMTGRILDAVWFNYLELVEGRSTRYAFLNSLQGSAQ